MNKHIEPCPFCGGEAAEDRDCAGFYNYRCTKCKCGLYGDYEHHATGRAAWNRRISVEATSATSSPPDSRDLLSALEGIVKSLADHDDEGMIEHAQPMIAARAAIARAGRLSAAEMCATERINAMHKGVVSVFAAIKAEATQPQQGMAMDFVKALEIATCVFDQYKTDHPKLWARMDGTPILNDVTVRMAEAYRTDVSHGSVPEGFVLVPIEPTDGMVIAGFESRPDEHFSPYEEWLKYEAMSGCQQAAHRARLCYAAMLAAAPTPPKESDNE